MENKNKKTRLNSPVESDSTFVKDIQITRSSRLHGYWSRHWALYAMLVLPLIFFFIFSYLPMINILLAFTQNNIITPILELIAEGGWVGMANFERAFGMIPFREAIRNTLMFSILDLVVGFPAPIILALLLNELKRERFKKITQTISYMPHFLSWVIVGGLTVQLFSQDTGVINTVIVNMGGEPFPFLTDNLNWTITNVLVAVWRSIGWNTIIYLAAITNVSPELYEAADMDGASRLRKMWHVTLPGIRPVIITLFTLTLGGIMGADLARFMAMDNNLVRGVAQVIPTYIYRWGLQGFNYSLGTAINLFQSIIGLTLILTGNWFVKKLGGNGFW